MRALKVLDLFAGLEGWSEPWRASGHDVISVDNDPRFNVDITKDVRDLDWLDIPDQWHSEGVDVLLASPPCEAFSVMTMGKNWNYDRTPKSDKARLGLELLMTTLDIIDWLDPKVAVIENPRGMMRKMSVLRPYRRHTVWYCHYGYPVAKPTDLWAVRQPHLWVPEPPCHNRADHGQYCCCNDHTPAPRGSRTGTQGPQSAAERAKVPYELSASIMRACQEEL